MLKKLCQCIGLASLILLVNYADLLGGGGNVRLHSPLGLAGICLAHIADILILTLGLFALLAPLTRTRFYPAIRLLLAILIPPYLIERTRLLYPFALPDGLVPVLTILWAATLLILLLQFPSWYRRIMVFASTLGAAFAFFALFSVAQLLWVTRWKPPPQQYSAAWALTPQPPREHPLLVWVLFDELSYDQVFEHRSHNLQLPNFDILRSQSTLFSNVQPVAYKTAKVLPSLITGHIVDDFRFDSTSHLLLHYTDQHGWHPLSGNGTLFEDAQKNGWRTAVVGWYNPYCTVYTSAIDNCYWTNSDTLDGPMAARYDFWHNTLSPLKQLGLRTLSPAKADRDFCTYDVQQHYQSHIDVEQHAFQLLHTDQADFIFLHLAIPHSPNIWSRINDDYTQSCDSSYLDNLALADREMGRILTTLQSSPRWKDTTLIVQGDHSWRVGLWNTLPAWTEEDDAASHEVFDPRPALLIHQRGQTQPQTNATAWPLIQLHAVLDQVLHGEPAHY